MRTGQEVRRSGPCVSVPDALGSSGLPEDAVQVRAADGTLGLGHPGALVVDMDVTACLALLLALHAVELAAVGLRHDVSLLVGRASMVATTGWSSAQPSVAGYFTTGGGVRDWSTPPEGRNLQEHRCRLPSPASGPTIWRFRGVDRNRPLRSASIAGTVGCAQRHPPPVDNCVDSV